MEDVMIDYSNNSMVPITTSYHGHIIVALTAKIKYTDKRHPKNHKCIVTISNRRSDPVTGLIYEYPYAVIKAWQGDNNTIHLLEPLPAETEDELNLAALFTVTPEQEDQDEQKRISIMGELFASKDFN